MSDKPKRTISEEQRKKMAEGRKKAMEKRKSEKAEKDTQKDIELKKELEVLRAQKDQMEAKAITKENRKKFREKMRSKSVTFDKDQEPLPVIEENCMDEPYEPEPEPDDLDVDQKLVKDEKLFKEHVEKLSENAKPETQRIFSKITSKYDNNVDITTNLRNMASELKLLIASNVEQIKTNNKVIAEAKPVREIEQPTFQEIREEQKYESQLASLMRLR